MPNTRDLYDALWSMYDHEKRIRGWDQNLSKRREKIKEFLAAPDLQSLLGSIVPKDFELTSEERVNSSDKWICFPYVVGHYYSTSNDYRTSVSNCNDVFVLAVARQTQAARAQQFAEIAEAVRLLVVDRESIRFISREMLRNPEQMFRVPRRKRPKQ
jgi:hypothetical protein